MFTQHASFIQPHISAAICKTRELLSLLGQEDFFPWEHQDQLLQSGGSEWLVRLHDNSTKVLALVEQDQVVEIIIDRHDAQWSWMKGWDFPITSCVALITDMPAQQHETPCMSDLPGLLK